MGSAFDWSPGGCCCTAGGFFDLYCYGGALAGWPEKGNQGKYVRCCTMYPVNADASDTRDTSYPAWVIEPHKPLRQWLAVTSDGIAVWAFVVATDGTAYCVAYDAQAKTQLALFNQRDNGDIFPVSLAQGFNSPVGVQSFGAVNSTQYAQWGGTSAVRQSLIVRNTDGSVATTGPVSGGAKTLADGVSQEITDISAVLDWPHFAVRRLTYTRLPVPNQSYFKPTSSEFIQCELSAGVDGHFAWGNPQTIRHVDYPSNMPVPAFGSSFLLIPAITQWLGYDHFGGTWAAGIAYQTGTSSAQNKIELIIGGQVVQSITNASSYAVDLAPHICFPHETLGDGYVAVVQTVNLQTGTGGAELVVYKNGAELWRTNSGGHMERILGSTDRWIYFMSRGATIYQMTNGEFTSATQDNHNYAFWIAKHDGSQIMPLGILNDTFGTIQGTSTGSNFNIALNGVPDNSMARNSAIIPNTLPATYQEMYDGRSGQ